ncbi:hypothetical protein AMD27_13250 [Acinetobacter sp. TGL-Y2]|uniref:hypothetical protein n=1 Tax=Acinetobacter sp. TGL-Y2 TaxID=1407071 RepID=UPI0007A656BA|nr:hypothetical protein [Acinetobacter sp. TGL-Y2]AMW79768.1 hypothetical protein AMD27_13250 [Acinetobacter sp. TGL-Y2]
MSPESIAALVSACAAISMALLKSKELANFHENNLEKRFKSSLEYDEKFFKKNDHQYSKIVKDNAARDAVGNKNVDSFLVDLLFMFHEYKLIELDEMIFLFESGFKKGYLKYNRTEDLQNCFEFQFSNKNSLYYLDNKLKIKKTKRTSKILFVILFWLLMFLSIFFAYMMSVSTNILDFIFSFIFYDY